MNRRIVSLLLAIVSFYLPAGAQVLPPDSASALAAAKKDLGEMLKRYTEKHPAVVKQRQKIRVLEQATATPQKSD